MKNTGPAVRPQMPDPGRIIALKGEVMLMTISFHSSLRSAETILPRHFGT
jgi:hypothetical protein